MRLAHHDVGGWVDNRYEVGHDASDTKVNSFYFLNLDYFITSEFFKVLGRPVRFLLLFSVR
jgi:hypothetical protein